MSEKSNLLPTRFDETLAQVRVLGIPDEEAPKIRDRLILAIAAATEQAQASGDLAVGDLSLSEWSARMFHRCERAVHDQLCEPTTGGIRGQYKDLLEKATSEESVNRIAVIVTTALAPIFPTLVVSSVIVYFSLWLTKVGLTYWCNQAVASAGR
jgi:hypothetical protein